MTTRQLSNREFGKQIGVSPSMASRIRNGKRLPSIRVLHAIATLLSIDLDALTEAHMDGAEEFGKLIRGALD